MKILRWLHTIYAAIIFVITFLFFFPAFWVLSWKKSWHGYSYRLNTFWGWLFMSLAFIRVDIEDRNKRPYARPCVYVANHFSYADISSMPLIATDGCFVGKHTIARAPLFGYYFRSLHIAVNRNSVRSRARVLELSIETLRRGHSLFIFPEGGIRTANPPYQEKYKDGAFVAAIRTGVPVVPVTLASNWRLLPDDGRLLLRGNHMKIVVHEAISTDKMTEEDVPALREKVFNTIQEELLAQNSAYLPAAARQVVVST